jgi:quercetin dioxygenase-like cupin family protein
MSTTLTFNFQHRSLVPFAHDYAHGDSEPWHQHDCAQLLHILSGVVRVETAHGYWVVPPGRGVWLPAGTPHTLRVTGARPREPCLSIPSRAPISLILPDSPGDSAAA